METIDYTPRFEEFWGASWRRGHKRAAFDTWVSMLEADIAEAEKTVEGWGAAFERRPADKRPHVSTWLNNRGWEDDLAAELAGAKNANPQAQVGKAEERLPDEERMNRLKQAILEHALHLSELEVPREVAELFVDAVAELKALHKERIGEMALSRQFQDIHDNLLDELYQSAAAEVPAVNWNKVRAGHKEEEVAKRAFATHCRKAAREHFGINDICEYDWEG